MRWLTVAKARGGLSSREYLNYALVADYYNLETPVALFKLSSEHFDLHQASPFDLQRTEYAALFLIHSSLMQDGYGIMLRMPCRITNHERYLTRTSRRGSSYVRTSKVPDTARALGDSFELISSLVSSDGLAELQSSSDRHVCRSFIQCSF